MRPAQDGSLKELAQSVALARREHDILAHDLENLAYAVAEREIASATNNDSTEQTQLVQLHALAPCGRALRTPLLRRAARHDENASAALLSLVEGGWMLEPSRLTELQTSPFGWSRAVAARAAVTPADFLYREAALNDHDPRVRQNALKACIESPDEEHRQSLVALLRRAPDSESRKLAAIALGVLGGDDSYRTLMDAFPRADVGLRLALVNAMAQKSVFISGGEQELVALARSEPGIVGVAAAVSLATGQSQARSVGEARLIRALSFGSAEEQRLAASAASMQHPASQKQLLYLGLRGEPLVQVTALGRWLERPTYRETAMARLRSISETISTEALLARSLLAEQKDKSVINSLREQQSYAYAEVRLRAARALYRLGDYSAVARSLADDSPSVRLNTACFVLAHE